MGLATDGNTVFVVGQYKPAGNIANPGFFQDNVLPAGSHENMKKCIPFFPVFSLLENRLCC